MNNLKQTLIELNGNPYRADGKLKAQSTMLREIRQLKQNGDSGQYQTKNRHSKNQMGGDYKMLPPSALSKAADWRKEVLDVQNELGISYKEALSIASQRRREENDAYQTTHQRYVKKLDDLRERDRAYRPYGRKNKRPLSLQAAQRILLQYYRQRGTPQGLRKDIASCHGNPKRTLNTCPPGIHSRKAARDANNSCEKSWKYRPGKYAVSPTGPGYYDIDGLDNLCGKEKAQMREKSKLYNTKFRGEFGLARTAQSNDQVINPRTGKKIKKGGQVYNNLVRNGEL
jgi:hypothetical protein